MADHNHITRDIKPRGVCPGCDLYWARHDERAAALDVTKLSRRVAHAVYALLFCDEPTYGPYTASEIVLYDPEAMSVQSTAAALREAAKLGLCMKRDAAAQNIKVGALLADREYPVEVIALGAALDEAISLEYTARMYDIEAMRVKARALREGVEKLAALRDAQVLA